MKFDIQLNASKKTITNDQLAKSFANLWQRIHTFVFFVLLGVAMVYGWLVWQRSLTGEIWSEQQKQEFLATQNKGVAFNEKVYLKVLEEIEKRHQIKAPGEMRDIFAK